jgi:GxxExxY protein
MPDELTEKIIGAAIEVHRELGQGVLETIYEEALCYQPELQGMRYERQVPADIVYKGKVIKGQRLDLIVGGQVVVEIKSLSKAPNVVISQTISYLKATQLKRGLVINFGEARLVDGIKRVSVWHGIGSSCHRGHREHGDSHRWKIRADSALCSRRSGQTADWPLRTPASKYKGG